MIYLSVLNPRNITLIALSCFVGIMDLGNGTLFDSSKSPVPRNLVCQAGFTGHLRWFSK